MLGKHDGATESHEETARGRGRHTSGAGRAGEGGVGVYSRCGRLIVDGSEANVDFGRALRVGEGNREQQGKVTADTIHVCMISSKRLSTTHLEMRGLAPGFELLTVPV